MVSTAYLEDLATLSVRSARVGDRTAPPRPIGPRGSIGRGGVLASSTLARSLLRSDASARDRLRHRASSGTLCLEVQLGETVLVLRGADGELWLNGDHEGSLGPRHSLRDLPCEALSTWAEKMVRAERHPATGNSVLRLRTAKLNFSLATQYG